MKPFALDTLVISDEWQGSKGTWFSVLKDARGIREHAAQTLELTGYYPRFTSVRRSPRRISMETYFMQSTDALIVAARKQLYLKVAQALDAEEPIRLIAVDNLLPGIGSSNLLRAMGPWDVRYSSGWTIEDLLLQGSGVLATGWAFVNNHLNLTGTANLTLDGTELTDARVIEIWWKPADDQDYATDRYLIDGNTLLLWYEAADNTFTITDGTSTVKSAAQTFAANALLHIVATWGTTLGLNLYVNNVKTSDTGHAITLADNTYIGNDQTSALPSRGELVAVRFYESLTATQVGYLYLAGLALADDPLSTARWLTVMPEIVQPKETGGKTTLDLVTTMLIDSDPRWLSRRGDYVATTIDATPHDINLTVTSDDEVYPSFYIKPIQANTTGFQYKQWIPVVWKALAGHSLYPVTIGPFDTQPLTPAKMQADGDDLRIYVDDIEVDRWLYHMDAADTQVWFNTSFDPGVAALLEADITAADRTTLDTSDDISDFPTRGILLIGTEAFSYSGKNNADQQFLGVIRGIRGTTKAIHSAGDPIYWIQHDIWMYYGDSTLTAPTPDDDYKPIFELSSTNDVWVYASFGEDSLSRPISWVWQLVDDSTNVMTPYTADHVTFASPWEEVGIHTIPVSTTIGRWYLYNPCQIDKAHFTNGERYGNGAGVFGYIKSSPDGITYAEEWSVELGAGSAWVAWSDDETLAAGAYYVAIEFNEPSATGGTYRFEVADAEISLDTTYSPDVSQIAEQANYPLNCTITNETTGEAISLLVNLVLSDVLEINTAAKTLTNLSEGSSHLSALISEGGVRKHWLKLVPGLNELSWAETGVVEVLCEVVWDRRLFE